MKLNGADGSVMWAQTYDGPGDDRAMQIAVDSKDRVVITGFGPTLPDVATLGGDDAFVSEYSGSDGTLLWNKVVSTAGDDYGWNLVYGTSGDIFWICDLGGAYDFGQPVIGPASPSSVIARIAP